MSGRIVKGHGRTKYVQSRYASSSIYEDVDESNYFNNWSDDDYDDDDVNMGDRRAVYRVRKTRPMRFNPYERRRPRGSDLTWTHDKFEENNNSNNEEEEDNNRSDEDYERTVSIVHEKRGDKHKNRWKHDKYDETITIERGNSKREHEHIHKSKSSRKSRKDYDDDDDDDDHHYDRMDSDDDGGDNEPGKICGYKVSVKGLSGDISSIPGLTKFFSKWGKIVNCGIDRDGTAGYVVYDDKEAAKDAVTLVTKTEYNGKKLIVSHGGLLIM